MALTVRGHGAKRVGESCDNGCAVGVVSSIAVRGRRWFVCKRRAVAGAGTEQAMLVLTVPPPVLMAEQQIRVTPVFQGYEMPTMSQMESTHPPRESELFDGNACTAASASART